MDSELKTVSPGKTYLQFKKIEIFRYFNVKTFAIFLDPYKNRSNQPVNAVSKTILIEWCTAFKIKTNEC